VTRVFFEQRRWFVLLWSLLCIGLASCESFEEKRIRELMKEKGFGTRAQGDATVENYLAGGDAVVFTLPPTSWAQPGMERLYQLTLPQFVAIDGTILIPYVGSMQVLGLTEAELSRQVKDLLRPVFKDKDIDIQARIASPGAKFFYTFGEAGIRGRQPMLKADLTLFEAVATIGYTNLANIGRVYLIRPDAENPLVMQVNMREMILTGMTARNFQIHENDSIYIPPTFLGMIARILERLFSPVAIVVQSLIGVAQVRQSYDIVTGKQPSGLFYRF